MAESSKTLEILVKLRDLASKQLKTVRTSVGNVATDMKKVPISTEAIGRGFTRMATNAGSAFQTIRRHLFGLQGLIAGIGIALTARSFLDVAKTFETLGVQLETIQGSSKKAEESLKWIADFTATTPYELEEVAGAFVRLEAYGIDATKWMQVLGDTASSMGKGIMQAVEMFADAMTGEFERIKEFGVKAKVEGDKVTFNWKQQGKAMSITAEKTADGITNALGEVFKRFEGGMEKQSKTWTGMMSNLMDQWTMVQKSIMDAGVFEELKKVLKGILNSFEAWVVANREVIKQDVPKYIKKFKTAVEDLWGLVSNINSTTLGLGLVAWLLWGPAGAAVIVLGLTRTIQKISELQDEIKRTGTLKLKGGALGIDPDDLLSSNSAIDKLEQQIDQLQKKIAKRKEGSFFEPEFLKEEYLKNAEAKLVKLQAALEELRPSGVIGRKDFDELASSVTTATSDVEDLGKAVGDTGKKIKEVPLTLRIKADISALQGVTAAQISQLDYIYEQGIIKAEEYYSKKKELLINSSNDEIKLLQLLAAEAAKEKDKPEKKFAIDQQIKQKKTVQDAILIDLERKKAADLTSIRKEQVDEDVKALEELKDKTLEQYDAMYAARTIKVEEYYAQKRVLMLEAYQDEIDLMQQAASDEGNLKARELIEEEIHQKRLARAKQMDQLAQDEANAIKNIVAGRLQVYNDIAQGEGAAFKDINDEKLKTMVDNLALQYQEQKKYFDSVKEGERWLAAKQKELSQEYLASTNSAYATLLNMSLATAEAIGQAFSNYFFDLMTGKFNTLREVAYNALLSIQRIASDVLGQMATDWLKKQAVEFMSTTKAAVATQTRVAQLTKEAAAQAKISLMLIAQQGPVYALAAAYTVLAAAKAAAGMAGGGGGAAPTGGGAPYPNVGAPFAEGGEIPGRSPHSKADNIPIWATGRSGDKPGEFMQPVKTVQHYGKTVMEGIRRMVYPKEVFSSEVVTDKTFQQHSSKITDSFKTTKDIYKSLLEDTMKVFTTRDMTKELVEKIIQPIKSVKPNIVRHLYKFIGAQRKSEGGSIVGSSPTPTSDNIPIWATAKEFMQPVKSVQHYGRDVMEGLRTRSIPKEIFSALRLPTINIPRPRMSYAGGGEIAAVRSSAENTGKEGKERELTILNVPDPSMVGQYLASADGMDMLVNIMSSRAQTFRRILF